jgi:hypothetical protein
VLRKLRADWRRGRALKTLKLGERQYWEWDSKTPAGTLCANLRFDEDDGTLVLTFLEIWAKDEERTREATGPQKVRRADLGLRGAFSFVTLVADTAADVGYTKLRIRGQRTRHRRKGLQSVDFDLYRFRQDHRPTR